MIQIAEHAEGCVVAVRAQPGAKRDAVVGEWNGMLKVAVSAAPEKGKANDAIVEVLAEALGVRRSQVEVVSGLSSREKKVLIRGLTVEACRKKFG